MKRIVQHILVLTLFPLAASAAGLLRNSAGDELQLLDHQVSVSILNGFATTEVEQRFRNTSGLDQEALFKLPLPERAALATLTLDIEGRELHGEVIPKQQAQTLYEEQRNAGKNVAQGRQVDERALIFDVGRVPAQGEASIRFSWVQELDLDQGIGRYVYPLADGRTDTGDDGFWSSNPELKAGFHFDLELRCSASVIQTRMPGFESVAQINSVDSEPGTTHLTASLSATDGSLQLDRDIVFYYRLDDSTPPRIEVIPYRPSNNAEGTFMIVATPGAAIEPINEGSDWIFVLDVSGSMNGGKINSLSEAVAKAVQGMDSRDRFALVLFNNRATTLTPGFVDASAENIRLWSDRASGIEAGGGTALFAGLKKAYSLVDNERTTSVILISDGVTTVGPRSEKAFLELIEDVDLRLFTFLIGNEGAAPLMQFMANASKGFAEQISESDDLVGRVLLARNKVTRHAMHDVKVRVKGCESSDLTPVANGNLYHGDQLIRFGHYRRAGTLEIEISGVIDGQKQIFTTTAELPAIDSSNPEIERLWAGSRIEEMMKDIRLEGETEDRISGIQDLATEFGLVTEYTSMLVMESVAFEEAGIDRRNLDRSETEAQARAQRSTQAVAQHRVDTVNPAFGLAPVATVHRSRSSGGGSGPMPWWTLPIVAALYLRIRKQA